MGFALRKVDNPGQSKVAPEYNPYLAARHEWDERYGDLVSRAKNWRTMALISGLMALLATGGMIWLSVRSRVVPFVVLIDSLGRPLASGTAEQASVGDDRLKRAEMLDWVENLRLVTTDAIAQRKAIDRVYAHIASGSHAQNFITNSTAPIRHSSALRPIRSPWK
jgi:type IV secretion system protein TrbF